MLWLIPVLPLLGATINGIFGRRLSKSAIGAIAAGSVGLCSYLLSCFWFTRKSAVDAGKKAFVVNRVGDFGFILAVMLIYWTFERVDFVGVSARLANPNDFAVEPLGAIGVLTAIGLLL